MPSRLCDNSDGCGAGYDSHQALVDCAFGGTEKLSPAGIEPSELHTLHMLASWQYALASCTLPWLTRNLREAVADAGDPLVECPRGVEQSRLGTLGIGHRPSPGVGLPEIAARLRLVSHLARLPCIVLCRRGGGQLGDIQGQLRLGRGDRLSCVILCGGWRHNGPASVDDDRFRSLQFGDNADPGKLRTGIVAFHRRLSRSYSVQSKEQCEQCSTGKHEIPP